MSKVDKKIIDRLGEKYKKEVLPSRKTLVILIVIGTAIGAVSSLHGMSEAWAWEVAKALISINGFLIGFSILGITVFSSRGYSKAVFRTSAEQSIDELISRLKDLGRNPKEITKEELIGEMLLSAITPFLDVAMIRHVFLSSMESLLVSIGFALFLFGVSTETVNNPFLVILFSLSYSLAIAMFILGAYEIVHGISTVLEKGTELNITHGFDIFSSIFDRKLKELEKGQAKKKKSSSEVKA